MKKIIASVLVAGISAFAADSSAVEKHLPKFDSLVKFERVDSVKLADFGAKLEAIKAKASADSAKFAEMAKEGKRDSAKFAGTLPDSIKAKFEAKRIEIDQKRDSLRADLVKHLDSVKVKVEALKADAKAKRAEFVKTLKADETAKIEKKIVDIEKKNDARREAIEKKIADIKAKIEAKKAGN